MARIELIIDGMSCDHCTARVQKALQNADGVAAVMIGRSLGKPVVITARGTDINLIPSYRLPRRQILWAADKAGL